MIKWQSEAARHFPKLSLSSVRERACALARAQGYISRFFRVGAQSLSNTPHKTHFPLPPSAFCQTWNTSNRSRRERSLVADQPGWEAEFACCPRANLGFFWSRVPKMPSNFSSIALQKATAERTSSVAFILIFSRLCRRSW